MAWDAALADEKTKEFQKELQTLMQLEESQSDVVRQIQTLWQKYYRVTGHKRLARVFLRENFL